jgi:hypothetical protein
MTSMTSLPRRLARCGFMLAAAGAGGYLGFCDAPHTWPTAWRAAAAGIVGVAFALWLADFLEPALRPLRQRAAGQAEPPATVADGISRLEEATAADAAERAATDAYQIDRGQMLLTDSGRWQGYRDGTARFFLAPGAHLRYWWDTQGGQDTPGAVFTLVTADVDDPVRVTDLRQLRRLLEGYATRIAAVEPGSPRPAGAAV